MLTEKIYPKRKKNYSCIIFLSVVNRLIIVNYLLKVSSEFIKLSFETQSQRSMECYTILYCTLSLSQLHDDYLYNH